MKRAQRRQALLPTAGLNGGSRSFVIRPLVRRRVEVKIVLALTAALLLNSSSPVHAQMPPGPYPEPPPGPGYPSPGYPPSPSGYGPGQWPSCDQLARAEQETVARLQSTPPSPERAAMEQHLREIAAARQSCW